MAENGLSDNLLPHFLSSMRGADRLSIPSSGQKIFLRFVSFTR